ncbi:uncharacterized protein LTR77_010647 [Saxophila tyrrhenica]|uniref:Glycosyltransferase family 34 protein n=1 Tax=Saxophila tyrrhenica TaxID=1690608 RepID=A0AAV9NUR4_9PEZI|nr:hypothetical protein LTR77_010647 [Saxophila tyrrhenica]
MARRRNEDADSSRSKSQTPETAPNAIEDKLTLETHQVRNIALGTILVVTFYILLQSLNVGPHQLERTTRQSLQAISHLTPESLWKSHGSKIVKVTSVFGQDNELYEGALRSHKEHNRIHEYDMKVLREKIVSKYWSTPTYLLSLVVEELAKPKELRSEWLMWSGPDVIILNPHVPLESFLPPADFSRTHLLGTHDSKGFNSGVFFLRVHDWSVQMLVEVLYAGNFHPEIERAEDKTQAAFDEVLRSDRFRGQVVYQPRTWYNAYQLNATQFEGHRGDLLVHFHDIGGDKWTAMADTLARTAKAKKKWAVPFEETTYESEISDYWERIRKARQLLSVARSRQEDNAVWEAVRRLSYALTYEVDDKEKMRGGMIAVQNALRLPDSERLVE